MRACLPLLIALLSGCGAAAVSTNAQQSMQQGHEAPPGPPSQPFAPPSAAPPPAAPPLTENVAGIWDVNDTVNGSAVSEVALMASGMYFSLAAADQIRLQQTSARGAHTASNWSARSAGTGWTSEMLGGLHAAERSEATTPWTLNVYGTNGALNLTFTAGSSAVPTSELRSTRSTIYTRPALPR